MGLVALFYYTLIILLVSIMTSAMCLSTFLVTHRKSLGFACIGFLFYFFDVALVFLDDFTVNSTATMPESVYFIGSQVASIVTGCGLFTAFWLMVCDALDEQRRALQIAPAVVFVIASLAIYEFMPAGNTHLFVFYGMRTLYLLWIMVYIAARYMGRSDALRERMWRHRIGYAGVLVLGAAVLIENILFLFYIDPVLVESGAVPFFPERNFAENALMLWMAAFIGASCYKLLSIHFEKPCRSRGPRRGVHQRRPCWLCATLRPFRARNRSASHGARRQRQPKHRRRAQPCRIDRESACAQHPEENSAGKPSRTHARLPQNVITRLHSPSRPHDPNVPQGNAQASRTPHAFRNLLNATSI